MQATGLYAANSMFVSEYLTTRGQPAADDFAMVADLGFEIVARDQRSREPWNCLLLSNGSNLATRTNEESRE